MSIHLFTLILVVILISVLILEDPFPVGMARVKAK